MTPLETLRAALVALTEKTYHYTAPPNETPPYLIWAEDIRNDFEAGGRHCEKAWQGTIDLYTVDEADPLTGQVEAALDGLPCCAWYINSTQYEEDTGLIHHEWVWTVA